MHEPLIRAIHASGRRFALAATGGGASAIGWLLSVPGGSRSVLEAIVPYSNSALHDYLRATPEQACSSRTARAMAMVAYERASRLAVAEDAKDAKNAAHEASCSSRDTVFGIGCTASLASDRPKRGEHRVHAALQSGDRTVAVSLTLAKDLRDRATEERITSELLLTLIAQACAVDSQLPGGLVDSDRLERLEKLAPQAWRELHAGRLGAARWNARSPDCSPTPRIVFPGAFNPLHDGHRHMAQWASDHLGHPVAFELSIENVDKPPLDFLEIETRGRQFEPPPGAPSSDDSVSAGDPAASDNPASAGGNPLWLTRAPTFVAKSGQFPDATFVVGADTIVRIADPKYYGDSVANRDVALQTLRDNGARFLVFGRLLSDSREFRTLDQLAIPPALLALCSAVPATEFREDVSSTELRQK